MKQIPLLDHDSPTSLHQQAEYQLRKLISDKKYSEGDLFPKEMELAKRWGISRNTLRQAIANLVRDGLLERKKRQGTRVTKRKITTDLSNWMSFTHEMEDKGIPFKNLQQQVSVIQSDKEVSNKLGIQPGTKIVCLKRVRSTGRSPMVYFESYFHPRVGLTGKEKFEQPLYEMLDEQFHIVPLYSQEEIKAIEANRKISGYLKINPGKAVLERRRTVLDSGRNPIEYNICYYRSDFFSYSVEIKRPI